MILVNKVSQCAKLLQKKGRADLALLSIRNKTQFENQGVLPKGIFKHHLIEKIPLNLYANESADKKIVEKLKAHISDI